MIKTKTSYFIKITNIKTDLKKNGYNVNPLKIVYLSKCHRNELLILGA